MSAYTDQRKRYHVYLPEQTHKAMVSRATQHGRSVGMEITRALGWYLVLMEEFDEAMVREEKLKEQKV